MVFLDGAIEKKLMCDFICCYLAFAPPSFLSRLHAPLFEFVMTTTTTMTTMMMMVAAATATTTMMNTTTMMIMMLLSIYFSLKIKRMMAKVCLVVLCFGLPIRRSESSTAFPLTLFSMTLIVQHLTGLV